MANTYNRSEFTRKYNESRGELRKSKYFQLEFEKYLQEIKRDYNGIAYEILLSQELFKLMDSYKRIDVFENLYPKYKNILRNSFCVILDRKYSEIKLAQISPDTDKNFMKNENGIEVAANDILKRITEKNKGKIVLLDFWATWCGPCLAEFEYSKKLAKTFEGKNIEFAFLCVKSERDKWEDRIREYNLHGSQYLLNDSEYDILSQKFQIIGIPHYVLIDKSGNVVDKNAPHPSNATELINLLKKYID